MVNADQELVWEGKGLGELLRGLVSGEDEVRWEAAEGVEEIWRGVGGERFAVGVREAVNSDGFPRGEFVTRLMGYRMALSWDERVRKEALRGAGMMSYVVFQALGVELLEGEEKLEEMLGEQSVASQALEALERIGVAGRGFVPWLMRKLDEAGAGGFEGAGALAAVGRGDAEVVGELVRRLNDGQVGAAEVLEEMGTDVAGRGEEIVGALHGMLKGQTWGQALAAMASVGRNDAGVMREVVGFARAREPRWGVVKKGKYEKKFDEVLAERGVAIEALGWFTSFGGEVVPALVAALGDFEEFESDWMGESEHGRVVASLRKFGAEELAEVVPVLGGHVWRADGEGVDVEVVRLLGEIGVGAQGALAELEKADQETERSAMYEEGKASKEFDPVAWAVGRIRGEIG